jgi:ferritin-like metal-binding protein YciE
MPPTLSNPRDLLLTTLAEALFIERMLSFEVLPEMLKAVSDDELAGHLATHLQETKRHVEAVEAAFRAVGAEPSSAHSLPFGGLIDQHEQLASSAKSPVLVDAVHAHAAAQVEQYEIRGYRTLLSLAAAIDAGDVVALLEPVLADEEHALQHVDGDIGRLAVAAARR